MAATTCMISPVIFGCMFGRHRVDLRLSRKHEQSYRCVKALASWLKMRVARPIGVGLV
jgi:hypothetical protein